MNKYWRIGTSSNSFFEKFSDLAKKVRVGTAFSIIEHDEHYIDICDNNFNSLETFTSLSTCNQYIKVWESMGFILQIDINRFLISTQFNEIEDLKKIFSICLLKKSSIKHVETYRKTIIINILVEAKVINSFDLLKKNICKTKGDLTIDDIKKSIGEYEKEISKNKQKIKSIKENYDKQF